MRGAVAVEVRPAVSARALGGVDGWTCALLAVVAIWIAHPAAEMAFMDEWSYVGSSLAFTKGRIAYYGASAMVGWQIAWGALFFKLFGLSFSVARAAMVPFAAGTVWLMHACLRRFGVGRQGAVLGALTLGFSPVFFPLATSFMTDTGALFGVLLCLWMCLRAMDAETDGATVRWLAAAILCNLVLGTDRQIVWLGALVMVPSTAWMLRRRRGVLPVTAALWVVSLLTVRTAVHWFSHQVGVQPAKVTGTLTGHGLETLALQMFARAPLCLVFLMLPAAVWSLARVGELGRGAQLRTGGAMLLAAAGYAVLGDKGLLEHAVMPWLMPIAGTLGMWRMHDELPGAREVVLGVGARAAFSLVVIAAVWALGERLWAGRLTKSHKTGEGAASGWRPVLYTLGAYSAVYFALLMPTALFGTGFFDRYLLFLLPLAITVVLKLFAEGDRVPVICYATLAVTGVYVTMATHDWYAALRARVATVARVEAAGVPKTQLVAGWEYDAWTQMEAQDFINYKDMVRPAGQVYTPPPERKRPCERGIVNWTPAIDPKYAITYSAIDCYVPSQFAAEHYRTWLPPFERTLMVLRVPGDDYKDADFAKE